MNKPIGTVTGWYGGHPVIEPIDGWIPAVGTVLYTAPPARQTLTDAEIDKIIASNVTITDKYLLEAVHMAIREVEAAHGIGGEE